MKSFFIEHKKIIIRNVCILLGIYLFLLITGDYGQIKPYTYLFPFLDLIFIASVIYFNNFYLSPKFLINSWRPFMYVLLLLIAIFIVAFINASTNQYFYNAGLYNRKYNFMDAFFSQILILAVLAGIISFIRFTFTKRKIVDLENKKLKVELNLIKNQINPHFFFNTLNNMYGLSVENSPQVPEIILKLSELLRYSLYESSDDSVLLKNEINFIKNYIQLHLNIKESYVLDDESYKISPHILIVFIENAFKHGVDSGIENPYIDIDLKVDKSKLIFEVKNNFITPEVISKFGGIGLENAKKHLSISYPKTHQLEINNINNEHIVKLIVQL
jgi:two-component system, LytTR family, sensor kinase